MFSQSYLFTQEQLYNLSFEADKSYIIFISEGCSFSFDSLKQYQADIFSIVIPAVIFKGKLFHEAALICELDTVTKILFCSYEESAIASLITRSQSALLFVNWLDPNIYHYLDNFFNHSHEDIAILGAGCGRTTLDSANVITHNGEYQEDGFLIIYSEHRMNLRAYHGSTFFDGYYSAHTYNANTLATINGEPASFFYTNKIFELFHKHVTKDNIFQIGIHHPLGMGSAHIEKPLRVPVAIDGDYLILSGPIEDESILSFMVNSDDEFLKASQMSAFEVSQATLAMKEKKCFVVECMGRSQQLGDKFSVELENIASTLSSIDNIIGILSLGEIANSADKYIEYFNETCAIGVFDATQ
ncbi:MAG: FIST C-terminal domain-containing protein [Sulfurospirillaceae bacterium]|nr:FIST C-terminal domain-containing protein [Sulfurospirillaceae bacterium]